MEELAMLLRYHAEKYPNMQPTDAVKLLYQNEFGGGHLIRDEAACLAYLHREYESVPHDPEQPAYDPIGNGLIRVHLAPLDRRLLEALGQAFLLSASTHTGSLDRFIEKLEVLRELTKAGLFAFDLQTLDGYLRQYRDAGYPAVSHSPAYRQFYAPAYRVVREDLWVEKKPPC